MAKNQYQMHIWWFFYHADVKMQKTVHETFKIQKLPFKNVFFFDRRVRNVRYTSSVFRNLAALLVQNKPSAPIRRKQG